MKNRLLLITTIGIAAQFATLRAQDHGHLYIGTNQLSQLAFYNGPDFSADSGYVNTMTYTNGGKYAGFYQNNITLAVLAATGPLGGPAPTAPAIGTFVQGSIVSLEGPPGGAFSFWDTNSTTGHPSLTYTNGQTTTNLYYLSENDGSPGSDPYGHIHGRRFTATKPGIYKVGFKVFDTSINGAGGGPIHPPSTVIQVYFQAGVNIKSLARTNNTAIVAFGATLNKSFVLEASSNLADTNAWTQVAGPLTGNDYFTSLTDTNATVTNRFYRVRNVTP